MKHTIRPCLPVLACLLCVPMLACDSGSDTPAPVDQQQSGDAAIGAQTDASVPAGKDAAAGPGDAAPLPLPEGDLGEDSENDTFLRADTLVLTAPNIVAKPAGIFEVVATSQAQQTINDCLVLDGNSDGQLDLSLLVRFIGTSDPKAAAGETTVGGGLCKYPAAPDEACKPDPYFPFQSPFLTYTPGTSCQLDGTSETATAPCFATQQSPLSLTLPLLGRVPLEHGQVIGRFDGDSISEGRVRGFLSLETAGTVRLPDPVPPAFMTLGIKPGTPLVDFLSNSELSEGPGGVRGWWFLLKFTAKPALFEAAKP